MSNDNIKDRQVVGFFRQNLILFWKNGLLFRRNISGTICEILVALLFLLILVMMRYFVDSAQFNDQDSTTNPLLYLLLNVNVSTGRNLILYYPNNEFVRNIVLNAYITIKTIKPMFNATGITKLEIEIQKKIS